jgi:hypothetical protein
VITVHEVHNVTEDSQQFLIARSLEILKKKFDPIFVGLVDCPNDLNNIEYAINCVGANVSNDRLDVYKKTENAGWLKYKMPELVFLGNFLYQKVDVVLSDLKTQFKQVFNTHGEEIGKQKHAFNQMKSHLEERLDILSEENEMALEKEKTANRLLSGAMSECETLRKRLANRDSEYKRLVRENVILCESASQDTDTIIKLNNEIGKLREHIRNTQQTNSFNYSPDYSNIAQCTQRIHNIDVIKKEPKELKESKELKKNKSIPDPSYDMCISAIQSFDRSKLKSIK